MLPHMYMCIHQAHVCICMYACTCTQARLYMHVHMYIYASTCVNACMYVHVHCTHCLMYMQVHVEYLKNVAIKTLVWTCMHICLWCLHVWVSTSVCVCMCTRLTRLYIPILCSEAACDGSTIWRTTTTAPHPPAQQREHNYILRASTAQVSLSLISDGT